MFGHQYRLIGPSALKVTTHAARNPDATTLFAKTMNQLCKNVEQPLSSNTCGDNGRSNFCVTEVMQSDQENAD